MAIFLIVLQSFLNFKKVLDPQVTGKPASPEEIRKHAVQHNTSLFNMEQVFLKDKNYLAGDDISIADVHAICELMQATFVGFDLAKDRPKLGAWFERVKRRLQPHFNQTHAVFNKNKERFFKFGPKL